MITVLCELRLIKITPASEMTYTVSGGALNSTQSNETNKPFVFVILPARLCAQLMRGGILY